MKEKLETVFDSLQMLELKPTPSNVSILNGAYVILREIYKELGGLEDGEEPKEGAAADPG